MEISAEDYAQSDLILRRKTVRIPLTRVYWLRAHRDEKQKQIAIASGATANVQPLLRALEHQPKKGMSLLCKDPKQKGEERKPL